MSSPDPTDPTRALTPLDWGAAAVSKAPGFATARTVVEFGAGDFSRSIALSERHRDKHFLSTDYVFSERALANMERANARPNLDVATLDVRTVDLPPASVDFVFSIALMEHVAELDECLGAVHRVLRPGGVYFYIQAPFWTCAQGHHYRHGEDRTYDFIPKYSHLTNDRDGLAAILRAGPPPPFDIDDCVDHIYGRPDLSRLGLRTTQRMVASGPLDVESWTETPDRRYDDALARAAHPRFLVPADFEELAVAGAHVVLRKAGGPARRGRGMIASIRRRLARS